MSTNKQTYTIICDDYRREMGNKFTLVGVYGDDINVQVVPIIFPKLCLVYFSKTIQKLPKKVTVKFTLPGAKESVISGNAPENMPTGNGFHLVASISPVRVEAEGKAVFKIYYDNSEKAAATHEVMFKVAAVSE